MESFSLGTFSAAIFKFCGSQLILFLSAAPADIFLATPASSNISLIEYRLVGGTLDMYFFSGPTSQEVVEQYTDVIGKPTWQPAWGLGFHLCRWGYKNISETMDSVKGMKDANIPLEGTWPEGSFRSR